MKGLIPMALAAAVLGFLGGTTACQNADPSAITMELRPLPGNPLVSFRILVKIGSAHDPAGKEGLCRLAWALLAEGGSRTRTTEEIARAFYPLAAGVSASVDKEMSVFSATVHADNLERFYPVFKEMLLDPGFRPDDFERLRTDQLNLLEKTLINNQDEPFGKEILGLMLYQEHPYGHLDAGTVEAVRGFTLDEVKAFYQENFVRGNMVIGLAGGYPAGFPEQVKADFEKLPATFTPRLVLPEPRRPDGLEFVIAEKETRATAISMGFPLAITKADKDFFALWIAGVHFGEHRQHVSWLFQKIREERGQNYGDYAYMEHFVQGRDKFPSPGHARRQQYFSIWIRPLNNANRHFVIRQALRELRRLVEDGLTEERFELARTYLLNYTRLYAQTLDERLGWQMDSHFYGYDDFLAEARKVLPGLKRSDVLAAVRKYLDPGRVSIAVITQDAGALRKALVADAPSPIQYVNPQMPQAVLDEDLIIQVYPLGVRPEAVHIAPASEFFRQPGYPKK